MLKNEYKLGKTFDTWMAGRAYDITFIVTEDCNLRCKYCYEVQKNDKNKMTFEIAKKAVDYIFENKDIFKSEAVVWNFIGGEPLLEIDLIDKIADYIKIKAFKENHPWRYTYRFNISTNGILYDTSKVQKFLKKNPNKVSIAISIDGNKDKHDLQRVYKNGKGSYDDVVKNIPLWVKQFPDAQTKVTIGSEDLKYVKESIIHLWNLGINNVYANVVFEDVWNPGDDILFENQLRELADYIIDNRLWNKYNTSLFSENIGYPNDDESLNRNNCGAGIMLAIDANGNLYPCLRYSDFCMHNNKGYSIGNINSGINFDKIRPFIGLTNKTQSDDECINCEIASGCGWCQGFNYDSSEIKTNYKRAKFICKMHKARYRANQYYWDKLRETTGIIKECTMSKRKYLYFITDDNCVEYCNYTSSENSNKMPIDIIKKGIEFCENNFYMPVILNSKNNDNIVDINNFSYIDRIEIYQNGTTIKDNNCKKIDVFDKKDLDKKDYNLTDNDICVLNISQYEVNNLSNIVKRLFEHYYRINLNLKIESKNFDYELYKNELKNIEDTMVNFYKDGQAKEFNKLTDVICLNSMDNCNAGSETFALAPNSKIYNCPKFYFENKDNYVGDLKNGIDEKRLALFKLEASPICTECDMFHCNRCVYLNRKLTGEFNTPSLMQCKLSMIEKTISIDLLSKLGKSKKLTVKNPFEKVLTSKNINPYDIKAFL